MNMADCHGGSAAPIGIVALRLPLCRPVGITSNNRFFANNSRNNYSGEITEKPEICICATVTGNESDYIVLHVMSVLLTNCTS